MQFAPIKKLLFSNSDDGRIIIWDYQTGQKLQELHHYVGMFAMGLTLDEEYIISCTDDQQIIFWNLSTFHKEKQIDMEEGRIRSLLVTDKYMITGDDAFRVVVWDLRTYNIVHIFRAHRNEVWSLTLHEQDQKLYSGDLQGIIIIHDFTFQSNDHYELQGHKARIQSLKISRDGILLISGTRDGEMKI